jgi:hypothetical protein
VYEEIDVYNFQALGSLIAKVVKDGPSLLWNTRWLNIMTDPRTGEDEIAWITSVNILIPHLVNLQRFDYQWAGNIDPRLLHDVPWAHLTNLGFKMLPYHQENLSVLHRFSSLRSLRLIYDSVENGDVPGPTSPWSLQLPHVNHFEFRWHALRIQPNVLRFLASCRFASDCKLLLNLQNLHADDSVILNPLFAAHPDSKYIDLYAIGVSSASNVLDRADHVALFWLPNPDLLRKIRLPSILEIDDIVQQEAPLAYGGVDHLLDTLIDFRTDAIGTCTPVLLRIHPQWLWSEPPDSEDFPEIEATFSQLRPYAERLLPLGVYMLDREDMDVHGKSHSPG